MIFDVRHITEIRYAALIRLARFNLRLRPATWPGQILTGYDLIVDPAPLTCHTEEGPYVVNISRLTLNDPIVELKIESRFTIKISPPNIPAAEHTPSLDILRNNVLGSRDLSKTGPALYLYPSLIAQIEPEIARWAKPLIEGAGTVLEAGIAVMQAIHDTFDYDAEATEVETLPADAFRERRGVCQDFAHIMIIALRAHAIPAAYVSGYLRTIPPPGKERMVGADATHAWVNLWCGDEIGWIGLDPTNNLIVERDHIFTAMGRDYADVSPVDGVFLGGAGQDMQVSVDVAPRA